MVVAPPFAYLHYHPGRWQWVFGATTPLAEKSVQKVMRRDIPATVCLQPGQNPSPHCAFLATPCERSIARTACAETIIELAELVGCHAASSSDSDPTLSDVFNVR
jgi:hypothetical protein